MQFIVAIIVILCCIGGVLIVRAYVQNKTEPYVSMAQSAIQDYNKLKEAYNLCEQSLEKFKQENRDLLDFFDIDEATQENYDKILEQHRQAHEAALKQEADLTAKKLEELKQKLAVEQGKLATRAQEEKAKINDEIASIRAEIQQWESKLNETMERYNAAIEQQKNAAIEFEELEKKCLVLSDDVKDDIAHIYDFIDQIHNKELLCKFIWSEYIRGPLDTLLRKQEIGEVPGIYKITNIVTKKAYIGRSVNMRKRIIDHFKSAVGIESIADQEIHHVMREQGFNLFMVEKLCECSKEELNDKEKYYISLFGTRDWGYNKNSGG